MLQVLCWGASAYMNIPLHLNNWLLFMFPQDVQKQKVDNFQRGSASVDRLMVLLHEGVYLVVYIWVCSKESECIWKEEIRVRWDLIALQDTSRTPVRTILVNDGSHYFENTCLDKISVWGFWKVSAICLCNWIFHKAVEEICLSLRTEGHSPEVTWEVLWVLEFLHFLWPSEGAL